MSAQLIWLSFGAFVLACLTLGLIAILKGDFRAGCETQFGKFFVEAKERSALHEKRPKKALK
jgi:hypothetical protein